MSLTTIMALSLTCSPSVGLAPPSVPVVATSRLENFDDLLSEFDQAYEAWRAEYKEADKDRRKVLRDQDPIEVYWPRFVASGDTGEGRALLWQLENLRKSGMSRKERDARGPELLAQLVDRHREEAYFGDALAELGKRARKDAKMLVLLERAANDTENPDNRAHAMFQFGSALLESSDTQVYARGEEVLEKLRATFEGSEWADEAYVRLMAENLKPGKMAPDFAAKTLEDFEFKLSDYRGKVVLLDFYGFW